MSIEESSPNPILPVDAHIDGFVSMVVRAKEHTLGAKRTKLDQIQWLRNARDTELRAHDENRARLEKYYTDWLEILETELRNIELLMATMGLVVETELVMTEPKISTHELHKIEEV